MYEFDQTLFSSVYAIFFQIKIHRKKNILILYFVYSVDVSVLSVAKFQKFSGRVPRKKRVRNLMYDINVKDLYLFYLSKGSTRYYIIKY